MFKIPYNANLWICNFIIVDFARLKFRVFFFEKSLKTAKYFAV